MNLINAKAMQGSRHNCKLCRRIILHSMTTKATKKQVKTDKKNYKKLLDLLFCCAILNTSKRTRKKSWQQLLFTLTNTLARSIEFDLIAWSCNSMQQVLWSIPMDQAMASKAKPVSKLKKLWFHGLRWWISNYDKLTTNQAAKHSWFLERWDKHQDHALPRRYRREVICTGCSSLWRRRSLHYRQKRIDDPLVWKVRITSWKHSILDLGFIFYQGQQLLPLWWEVL